MEEIRTVYIGDSEISYTLIRKKIKNMYLRVRDGSIIVTANARIPKKTVDLFVQSNEGYIRRHLTEAKHAAGQGSFVTENEHEQMNEKALRAYAEALLLDICREYYPFFEPYGIAFPKVTFRHMTSRWGSCRPQKHAITLNTALIKVPREAAEYVVVHEFAHFIYPDHSSRFYAVVAQVLPDWKERRKLLRNISP